MSAFHVSKEHIDAILAAALHFNDRLYGTRFGAGNQEIVLSRETASVIGSNLWEANRRSVNQRYEGDTEIGEVPQSYTYDPRMEEAEWLAAVEQAKAANRLPEVEYFYMGRVYNLIACLDYQSCEASDWVTSDVKAFLDTVQMHMHRRMPGYRADSGWVLPVELPAPTAAPRTSRRRMAR